MKINDMKKFETGFLNTPIHKLNNLSKKFGMNIYIKRDDMTGFALGGNKTRKLDYLLADAAGKNCTVLLTYGGQQTNHGRLTAAAASRFGFKCAIIMDGPAPSQASGNLILDKMMGADLFFMDDTEFKKLPKKEYQIKYNELVKKSTDAVVKMYEDKGEKVYLIPIGGSSPVGAAGYIEAAREIKDQLKEMNLNIDYVFTGFGSVGTFGGLYIGAKYYNTGFTPVGICVSHKNDAEIQEKIDYMNETAKFYEMDMNIKAEDLWIEGNYVGIGYNIPDEETRKYVYMMAKEEAIILDPCYTGKTFRGMIDIIETGVIPKDKNVMFLHTGGAPGLFSEGHTAAVQDDLWSGGQIEFRL